MTPRSVPAGFHGAGREPSALQHQGEGCPGPSTALGDQKCAGDLWQGPHTCAQHLKCVPLCVGRVLPGAERAPALPGASSTKTSGLVLVGSLGVCTPGLFSLPVLHRRPLRDPDTQDLHLGARRAHRGRHRHHPLRLHPAEHHVQVGAVPRARAASGSSPPKLWAQDPKAGSPSNVNLHPGRVQAGRLLWGCGVGCLGSLCCLWGARDARGAAGLCHPCRYRLRKQSHDYEQGESLRGEDMTLRKVGAGWGHAGGGLAPGMGAAVGHRAANGPRNGVCIPPGRLHLDKPGPEALRVVHQPAGEAGAGAGRAGAGR